jgi:hypothetical protein
MQTNAAGLFIQPAYFPLEFKTYLINRKILSIESFSNVDMFYSPNYPGIPVIGAANFLGAFLTLLRQQGHGVEGGDFYKSVPMKTFRRCINYFGGNQTYPEKWQMSPVEIDWQTSYISIPTTVTTAVSANTKYSFPLLITYSLPDQDISVYPSVEPKRHG